MKAEPAFKIAYTKQELYDRGIQETWLADNWAKLVKRNAVVIFKSREKVLHEPLMNLLIEQAQRTEQILRM